MTYVSENFWHDAVNKATTDLFTFGYKHIIKPFFVFNQTPDVAHDQMIQFCKITKNIPPLMWACREMLKDRKSTRLNSSHSGKSRMPSSA